ncbi:Putative N-acetylgalactosaminyl-diphosphoundecaprenol glucuronosyltransferase [hydrothermal vent metagenome]|uniref:N-acetylgalactosaminyl-diphosphoundecaprenol glucuronosyltransferase n=1 Tax=hydrothermal vent metagenome TaxID=652676 RepID=A0A3B1DNG0_9ZZZZ
MNKASDFSKQAQKNKLESISVIIPVFNRKHLISRALHSVLKQTLPVHEIIVIDDGSTDGVGEMLYKKFPQVQWIQQNRQGVSAARNRGIRRATGDCIALLDADDAWLPDKLSRQISALNADHESPLCHTNEIWIRNGVRVNPMKKHEKKGGWIFQHCLPHCTISPSSSLMKRDLFKTVGYFDETLPVCEDYDLWLKVSARYPVLFIETALSIKYGGHDDQLSKQYWGMDRFRVQALDQILSENVLKKIDQQAAYRTLHQKCRLLIKGAIKHQNQSLQNDCESILKRHPLPEA